MLNHAPTRSGQRNLRSLGQRCPRATTGPGTCCSAGSAIGCATRLRICSWGRHQHGRPARRNFRADRGPAVVSPGNGTASSHQLGSIRASAAGLSRRAGEVSLHLPLSGQKPILLASSSRQGIEAAGSNARAALGQHFALSSWAAGPGGRGVAGRQRGAYAGAKGGSNAPERPWNTRAFRARA